MPAARIGSLFGTQYQTATLRAVPPSSGAFSSRTTSLPSQRLNSAAGSPPPPPPTTTMSASTSTVPLAGAGAGDSRAAIFGALLTVSSRSGVTVVAGPSDLQPLVLEIELALEAVHHVVG